MLPYGVDSVLMIGIPELLDRINHDLLTGRAFSRGYDEYRFPVATADEQVATERVQSHRSMQRYPNIIYASLHGRIALKP